MADYSTHTRIVLVFACKGVPVHIMSGLDILRASTGYHCPYCLADVEDVTDTPIGMAYFAHSRPDLYHRKPHRSPPPPTERLF